LLRCTLGAAFASHWPKLNFDQFRSRFGRRQTRSSKAPHLRLSGKDDDGDARARRGAESAPRRVRRPTSGAKRTSATKEQYDRCYTAISE